MPTLLLKIISVLLAMSELSKAQRRIIGGRTLLTKPKPFMVYLVKARSATVDYDAWICGGVIVSPRNVVTAAACVEDVKHAYVISSYDKYVNHIDIYSDPCTSASKKKIVYVCLPKTYNFAYDKVEKWANIDVAVARVESPYIFNEKPSPECSYGPEPIPINYNLKFQMPDTDAYILGWGHQEIWRQVFDKTDYNSPDLLYASTKIQNKSVCLKEYSIEKNLIDIIDKFMICAFGNGSMDADGNYIGETSMLMGCTEEDVQMQRCIAYSRRWNNQSINAEVNISNTRRAGICQNDHGGPLITWVGSKEHLIGIASVFRISIYNKCTGPFLYTSTACTSGFLNCIVSADLPEDQDSPYRRAAHCQKEMQQNGMTLVERNISWINHPDGPAADETPGIRPKPIQSQLRFKPNKITSRSPIATLKSILLGQSARPITMITERNFLRLRPQRPINTYFRKHQDNINTQTSID